jgi:hypothetical protein
MAPRAKTERAKTQIRDLDFAIRAFFKTAGYGVVSEVYPETDEEIWRFELRKPLPHDLSVRVGEILHNLRSALDNMLAEIVVTVAKRSDTKVEFPFGRDFSEFEAALGKQKKLPADAVELIKALKPYNGGDPLLWMLHSVNRQDKHRMGLVPINLRTEGFVSYLSLRYGQGLVIGSRSGQHLTAPRNITDVDYIRHAVKDRVWGAYGTILVDLISGLPADVPRPGERITWIKFENVGAGSAKGSFEFFVATPGTKIKTDFQPSFDVAFRDIGGFERKPIVHVLAQLRDLVERILLTFERRFFPK